MLTRLALQAVALLALSVAAYGATVHVSPEGDDANDGLGPGRAMRTVQAAVNKLGPGDTCLAHEGVYRETVVFPRSGAEGKPIALRAASRAVVVTGCDPVLGWERFRGDIWKAPMPWTMGIGRNQAFAGQQVLIEARYPNEPAPGLGMYISGLSPLWPTFGEFSIPKETVAEQPGRIVSKLLEGQPDDYWKGAVYQGIHYEGWAAQTGVVESSKSGEILVGDRTETWWFGSAYGGGYSPEEGRGMLIGHMNALDRPGEWHWQDGVLYLIPPDGGEPASVEAKRRPLAFDLSGREHIRIEGFTVRAASMRLEDSAYCVVDDCDLSYVSHFTKHYSMGQIEKGRDTIRSGETGIFVGGHDNAFLNCSVRFSAGAGFHLRGYHHTIHNCLIDEVSYTAHYLNAITDAVSDFGEYEGFLVGGHVITYNTMRNVGRHCFNIHGNGTSLASRTRGPMDYMATLFVGNHLYNGMLLTKDAGMLTGYYCSGGTLDGLHTQLAYNVMHDSYDIFAMRIGVLGIVYLDAGTCDVDVHHNLLWAAPGSLQRGFWFNTMCVDIREHDNVFHPDFERTCAELRAEDFPEEEPFRFGHDFANPPPLPVWPQLERKWLRSESRGLADGDVVPLGEVDFDRGWQSAVVPFASDAKGMNADGSARQAPRHQKATDPLVLEAVTNDGAEPRIGTQWTFVHTVNDGAWLRFASVPLGEGYRHFRVIYGTDRAEPRWLEMRLDAADGPVVARVDLPQTDIPRGGRVQIYQEAVAAVGPEATGTHDVFLVFHTADGGPVGEFEYFRFEQYRGQIGLQKGEVRYELRVGSPKGDLMGVLYPRATGGMETYRSLVASLEPAKGRQPLVLVVRSAVPGPTGAIAGLSLERAKEPIDWTGVGIRPKSYGAGRLVFPEPTNRPQARPGDAYASNESPAQRPPLCLATVLDGPLTLDGKLDDWPAPGPGEAIALQRGQPGGAGATARVASDPEALYVAVESPLSEGGRQGQGAHRWGRGDGCEIRVGAYAEGLEPLTLRGYPDGHGERQLGARAGGIPAPTYAAAMRGDSWLAEWRVPFSGLGLAEAPSLVRLSIRVRRAESASWEAWPGSGAPGGGLVVLPQALQSVPTEGLALWLDAAQPGAVVTDDAGRVGEWGDRSGAGRNARQDDPQLRPFYVHDGLNGMPALRFSETETTRMEIPDLAAGKTTATIFAVISNPEPGSDVNHDPRILTASDGKEFDYMGGLCASVTGMETGGPRQAAWTFTDRSAQHVRLGCFSPSYQTYFTGLISELLVYTRVLTADEQDLVRAHLMAKWGLSE